VSSTGIAGSHAYSLIDTEVVKHDNGKTYRLVKIRNPWGAGAEWNGDFSDKSNLWTPKVV
jgi:hypothetical protein